MSTSCSMVLESVGESSDTCWESTFHGAVEDEAVVFAVTLVEPTVSHHWDSLLFLKLVMQQSQDHGIFHFC